MTTFKDHFSTAAQGYAAYRPSYPPALAAWLASLAPSKAHALDCGCGNGQFSVLLGNEFEKVTATDASASQIANAEPHPHVSYRTAPAEASGLPGKSVDLVTVAQAAHWFDLPAFYAEAVRVAKPGAVIALIAEELCGITPEVDAAVARFYGGALKDMWPPERRHIETGYTSLAFPFAEIAPPAAGFTMEAEWTLAQFIGYLDTWSAVRALEKAGRRAEFDTAAEEIAQAWGSDGKARPVRWPLIIRAGRIAP